MPGPNPLLNPVKVGAWDIAHRIVYAPLTRCRCPSNENEMPKEGACYYSQRATEGGLMISEATVVDPHGYGYPRTPGIFTDGHVEAWKPIVKAVHGKGAKFLCQLWHCGRVSHQEYQPDGQDPVSASPIAVPKHKVMISSGAVDHPVPRQLSKEELKAVTRRFVNGAKNALAAGFDGVEIHSANGYLLDSFLKSSSNQREDEYGGCIENRARWPLEVYKAVADEVGADKVGIRFSPFYVMGAEDEHKYAMFTYVLECLNDMGLAYVHMVEPRAEGKHFEGSPSAVYEYRRRGQTLDVFRNAYKGTFLAAGGHTRQSGIESLESNHADLIVYGRHFLANPDLPRRFELDAPLNEYDRDSFYSADLEKGYTDYPFLTEEQIEAAEKNQANSSLGGRGKGKAEGVAENAHLGNAY